MTQAVVDLVRVCHDDSDKVLARQLAQAQAPVRFGTTGYEGRSLTMIEHNIYHGTLGELTTSRWFSPAAHADNKARLQSYGASPVDFVHQSSSSSSSLVSWSIDVKTDELVNDLPFSVLYQTFNLEPRCFICPEVVYLQIFSRDNYAVLAGATSGRRLIRAGGRMPVHQLSPISRLR